MTTKKPVWQAPTRRAFVAMLGLGAAALAAVNVDGVGRPTKCTTDSEPAPALPTRWIGHC